MSDGQQFTPEERAVLERYGKGDPAKGAKALARYWELKREKATKKDETRADKPLTATIGERLKAAATTGAAGAMLNPLAMVPAAIAGAAGGLGDPQAVGDAGEKAARFVGEQAVDMVKDEVARAPSRMIAPIGGPMMEAPIGQVVRDQVEGKGRPVTDSLLEGQIKGGVETALGGLTEFGGRLVGGVGRRVIDAARGRSGVTALAKEVGEADRLAIKAAERAQIAKREAAAAPAPVTAPAVYAKPDSKARSFYEKSLEISKQAGDDIFSPAEMTGDPAIALAESKALQFPRTMRAAQAQRSERLQGTAKFLDAVTDSVAADPAKIGNVDMAGAVAGAVERHIQSLKAARSEAATPLYEQAEKLLGSKKVAPIDEVTSFVSQEIERAVGPFQPSAAPLKQTLEALQADARAGFANIKTVRSLAEKWGQQADGTGDLLKDLPIAQRKYVASKMSELLNRSIDAAAASGKATDAGIQALRQAQSTWRTHSEAIDALPQEALGKVLKIGGGEAGDTLVDRMLTMSPEQLRGVSKVIRKTDPAAAQQLGAEFVESLLVRGGKPQRGASIAAEIGAAELKPGQALSLLGKHEAKLRAFYDDDGRSIMALTRIMETLKRKSVGPGLRGSQTAPLIAQALEDAGVSTATAAAGGPSAGAIAAVLKRMLGSERAMAEAVTDPAKVKLLDEAIQAQLKITEKSHVPMATLRGIILEAERLGIGGAADRLAKSDERRPDERRIAGIQDRRTLP